MYGLTIPVVENENGGDFENKGTNQIDIIIRYKLNTLNTLHTENKLFSKAVRADRKFLDRQATHYSNLKEYSSLYIK